MKFSTQFSMCLDIVDMVFNTVFDMLHNIAEFQNSTFHIFDAKCGHIVFLSKILNNFLDGLSYNKLLSVLNLFSTILFTSI